MATGNPVVLAADIEAAQVLREVLRHIRSRGAPPAPVGRGKTIEQGRGGACKRHLQMQGERVVVDSSHGAMRTNMEQ